MFPTCMGRLGLSKNDLFLFNMFMFGIFPCTLVQGCLESVSGELKVVLLPSLKCVSKSSHNIFIDLGNGLKYFQILASVVEPVMQLTAPRSSGKSHDCKMIAHSNRHRTFTIIIEILNI